MVPIMLPAPPAGLRGQPVRLLHVGNVLEDFRSVVRSGLLVMARIWITLMPVASAELPITRGEGPQRTASENHPSGVYSLFDEIHGVIQSGSGMIH